MGTDIRAMRIDGPLWSAALAKARGEGRTLTDVIRDALRAYTGAAEVAGITVQPDLRVPDGTAALVSGGEIQAVITNLDPEPARKPPGSTRKPRREAAPVEKAPHRCTTKGWCGTCQEWKGGRR